MSDERNNPPSPNQCGSCATAIGTGVGTAKVDCPVCGESPASRGVVLYMSLSMMDKCTQCGSSMPVAGPQEDLFCETCTHTVHTDASYWSFMNKCMEYYDMYEFGRENTMQLGMQTEILFQVTAPKCTACKTPYPVADIATGTNSDISCPHCGAVNPTFPATRLTSAKSPSAVQFFGAAREGENTGQPASETVIPVSFRCPGCHGNLKISTQHDRTITCEYCGNDCFLPDPIWLRLHPVRTRTTWFVRFEDPEASALAAAERQQQAERGKVLQSIVTENAHLAGSDASAAIFKTFFSVTSKTTSNKIASMIQSLVTCHWDVWQTGECIESLRSLLSGSKRELALLQKLLVLVAEQRGDAALTLLASIKTS